MQKLKDLLNFILRPFRWFRATRRRNKVATIIGLIIVLIIIVNQVQAANAKPQYVKAVATRENVTQLVSETGNVNTAGRVDVPSTATGIIESINVQDNDTVQVGQELFRVRSTATDQEKASANATYKNALSGLATAQQSKDGLDALMWTKRQALLDAKNAQDYKNNNQKNPKTNSNYTDLEKLSIDNAVVSADKDFTSTETKYKQADIAVSAAQAEVTSAKYAYDATQDVVVKSPAQGTVTNLSFKVGDKVSAGSLSSASTGSSSTSLASSAGGTTVLTIANLVDYSVKLAINEVDIPKVAISQSAKITLDAFTDRTFDGLVTHVDEVGTNDQGIVTYNVVIDITDPIDSIRPGMTANADIEVAKAHDAVVVPNSAIKPYHGEKAVQVLDEKTGEPKYIPVKIGIKSPEKTQIVSGIDEGTEVITATKGTKTSSGILGGQ